MMRKAKDAPSEQLCELVTVSILDNVMEVIVQPAWREGVGYGEECVYEIGGLINLIPKTTFTCGLDTRRVSSVTWSCWLLLVWYCPHLEDEIKMCTKTRIASGSGAT